MTMTHNRSCRPMRALMILGPTASGKTAVSLKVAQKLAQKGRRAEIISVDSALVYRGMDIGTAKPTPEERGAVPHHLIDVVEPEESFSAADFAQECERLIGEIAARGAVPLIVGGTMLYAKALREGMDALPSTTPEVRAAVQKQAAEIGWSAMHAELAEIDPVTAARLAPGDSQRIARALEVWRMTGTPLSSLHSGAREVDETLRVAALLPDDRAKLHAAIGERFEAMVRAGFLDEVRGLASRSGFDADAPSMRAVGYRQALQYLAGEYDEKGFIEAGKAATRQLAKRQITWLRGMMRADPSIEVFDPYAESLDSIASRLTEGIERDYFHEVTADNA